jgi:hypothetical protein
MVYPYLSCMATTTQGEAAMTTTTETDIIFLHDDGRCTCLAHAGNTLRSEYEANPTAIHFPGIRGTWERMTDEMVREAMELNAEDDAFDYYPECETCADADYTYTTNE